MTREQSHCTHCSRSFARREWHRQHSQLGFDSVLGSHLHIVHDNETRQTEPVWEGAKSNCKCAWQGRLGKAGLALHSLTPLRRSPCRCSCFHPLSLLHPSTMMDNILFNKRRVLRKMVTSAPKTERERAAPR